MPTAEGWRPYLAPFRVAAADASARLGPAGRLAILIGLAVLALVGAALAFFASTHHPSAATVWLYGGRIFEPTEASALVSALRAARLPCVEAGGRVGVPASHRLEALETLARAKLGPRPIGQLLEATAEAGSIWESPEERASRQRLARARVAAELIGRLRGVNSATVTLTPTPTGSRLHPETRLKAMALVETEGGQVLPTATVEMIRHILTAIDNVDPDAITLFNPTAGHEYLVAGRPEVAVLSNRRGREEELRSRLLDQLRIEGALVSVRIDAPPLAEPPPPPQPTQPAPSVARANQPIRLDTEPSRPTDPPPPPPRPGRAFVLVRIPRSHYLRLFHQSNPQQPPTPEALEPIAEQVRQTIHTIVQAVIPPDELGQVVIDRIDDSQPPPPPTEATPRSARRLAVRDWLPIAATIAVAAVALAAWIGATLARRQTDSITRTTPRGPHRRAPEPPASPKTDNPQPGSLERLIERDPDAAAGVLRRWIHQGEHKP
jgi:flagellar biosynthesis/type III secretory pathway M-ring protein FliF/YscJ